MNSNWTPGPWHASQPAAGFADIRDSLGRLVFAVAHPSTICNDPPMSAEEKEANLHLCAAAPELYAALRDLVDSHSGNEKRCGHQFYCICPGKRAKEALAKAEGEQR